MRHLVVHIFFCFSLLTSSFGQQPGDALRSQLLEAVTYDQKYDLLLQLYRVQEGGYNVESQKTSVQLVELARSRYNQKILAEAYIDLARSTKIHVRASRLYFKALDIHEALGDTASTITSLNAIGEIFRATGDFERSLTYLNRAVELCNQTGDKEQLAYSYNRIGAVYYEVTTVEDPPAISQSIKYTNQSIQLAEELKNSHLLMSNMNILGAVYLNKKEYAKAFYYLNQSLRLIEDHNYYQDKSNILNNIATYYLAVGEYGNAVTSGIESYRIAQELNIQTYLEVSTSILAEAYYKKGDYRTAYDYSGLSHKYYNEGFYNERNQKIFEIETKYETEKKELQLQAQKSREVLLKLLLFSVTVLATSIIVLIFVRARHLKRMNSKINRRNELIVKQNNELEELIAERNRFFSIIAHDLRSPFTSIIGYTDLLLSTYDSLEEQEKKDYLMTLKMTTEQTYGLIINLLQWAYNQTGKLDFAPEKLVLEHIITENIKLLRLLSDNKNIRLQFETGPECLVYADEDMVNTIVRNLISNAIKFSHPHSAIDISCSARTECSQGESGPMAEITIRDRGVGISPENMARLFKVGERIQSRGTANETGTGLGLILCKEFVDKNGGTIRVESEAGKGSRFIFTLPLFKLDH